MTSKISSMLDAVANSLEAKGLIKEAFEIDKVADIFDEQEKFKKFVKYFTRHDYLFDPYQDYTKYTSKDLLAALDTLIGKGSVGLEYDLNFSEIAPMEKIIDEFKKQDHQLIEKVTKSVAAYYLNYVNNLGKDLERSRMERRLSPTPPGKYHNPPSESKIKTLPEYIRQQNEEEGPEYEPIEEGVARWDSPGWEGR